MKIHMGIYLLKMGIQHKKQQQIKPTYDGFKRNSKFNKIRS